MIGSQHSKWLVLCMIVVVSMCLAACSAALPSPDETALPATPTSSPSTVSPSTPELPTGTPTSSPVLATRTPYSTRTPTPTFAPTLTADERYGFVREMLETNNDCELPCWWGVIPGKTDWPTVLNRFRAMGGFVFDIPHPEHLFDYRITLSFVEQQGVVQSISVASEVVFSATSPNFAQDWHRYSPDQVLNRYGEPSQVYIQLVPPIEPGSPVYYQLWLAYDHLGFYIVYTGPATYEPPIMRACPRWEEVTAIALRLQSPRAGESVLESPGLLRTLEEAGGMNVERFYETFRNAASDSCIESPAAMWP